MTLIERKEKEKDKDYIKRLEEFISDIESKSKTRLIAYFGLKKYVETNSKILSELRVSPDDDLLKKYLNLFGDSGKEDPDLLEKINKNIADFEDKAADKMLKFADKMDKLLKDLDTSREALTDMGVDVGKEEKKFIIDSAGALEKHIDG